ncbi:hypothetical protein [Streptomyces sp. cmx-4-9]|uniref:hypothetical protein n=1 Tax=Streptomyces sp. cmx-4-9 TaxID=2790941 RepID=UPI00397FD7EE
MQNIAVEQQRGHVLLIAGDAAVRRRTVQVAPSANLAALGVVPVPVLLNSGVPCDTTYLDGARDPNTVLTRLRAAAATPGPLLVYLSGRLSVDRRTRRLHLCLAGTTTASVRYTGLPWEWLATELRGRPAALTTVLLDLAADKAAWPLLQEYGGLPAAPCAEVYGVVLPPGCSGGGEAVSGYTREWIRHLRSSPGRPGNLPLHALAVGAAALPPGALVLPTARELGARVPREGLREAAGATEDGRGAPEPRQRAAAPQGAVPPLPDHAPQQAPDAGRETGGDPRLHLHALATEGRHEEAAALAQSWEQHVLRTCGHASPEAVQCAEIRADLARMAGDFRLATRLWTGVGRARLARQDPDAPEVTGAAAGALYCWTQLKDRAAAAETGPELIRLLRALPSLDPRHLHLARRRLDLLQDGRPDAAPRLPEPAELP